MPQTYDFDLFVIGGGSGGVRAARIASDMGKRVASAEMYRYGGTCVIRGCVPKKLLVYASHFREDFKDSRSYGWSVSTVTFDWQTLIQNVQSEVDRLNGIYSRLLDSAGVSLNQYHARIVDPHAVSCNGKIITARHILIATGAEPFVPDIPGRELAITSNEVFHLSSFPTRILIVGGGYIAVEFAGIFNGLGSKTHLVYRGDQILRGFDADIRQAVHDGMESAGVQIQTMADVVRLEKSSQGISVDLTDGARIDVDCVLYATGRRPCTTGLGLEDVAVTVDSQGAIIVNKAFQTSVPSIYAVGDVINRMALTPVALREGQACVEALYGSQTNEVTELDYSRIPTAIFSQPQAASVGLTETEAKEKYQAVDIYKTRFRAMKHALTGQESFVVMKLITDADTDRVLGVHLVGPESAEIIQVIGIAIGMNATKADFDRTVAVHPTGAEELVTLKTPTLKYRRDPY